MPWAGPKASPGKECAIMMWSRTSSANIRCLRSGVSQDRAQSLCPRCKQNWQTRRSICKRNLMGEQRFKLRCLCQKPQGH
ncbi:hypothetical protein E2L05_11045 [Meridianimarinicoccus aquatilis]|uniref:Anaphase-promoting complex subunit 11 RING-H2 finger domain-containing protein n=1 Tax=Meridianimarinicoccus aquatilis TaxID=2552766 RepID=A0A4R6AZB8_9RHOB|nr:hypothetical protein E2L05_11045 [Fluviibacterium aquatile]